MGVGTLFMPPITSDYLADLRLWKREGRCLVKTKTSGSNIQVDFDLQSIIS